jgi:hypothetical protein
MPYADPTRCPDCRAALPTEPTACPGCDLPLQDPLAASLFRTLQTADEILVRLRATAPVAVTPGPAAAASSIGPETWTPDAYPTSTADPTAASPPHGLSAASIPKILLGLGALCLLVAAVIFLAVAWSWLGVGGRTAVLVGLTLVTGALGTRLGARGLRVAAESLTAVALGLLALDVTGADNAGWLGDLTDSGLACVIGGVLLLAALALMLAPAGLVVPQVVSALGLAVLVVGASGQTAHDQVVAALAVLAFAGLAVVGRRLRVAVLPWLAAAGGAVWWASLALDGFAASLAHPTLTGLWVDGHGWALLASAALLLVPAAFLHQHPQVVAACGAGAALITTVAVALPGLDEGATRLTLVSLGALVVWAASAAVTPTRWALVPAAPLGLATVPVSVVSAALLLEAVARVGRVAEPFTRDAVVPLPAHEPFVHPALLVPSLLGLLLAFVALRPGPAPDVRVLARVAAATLGLGALGTLALAPVPLWTVVALISALGAVAVVGGLRRSDAGGTLVAGTGTVLLLLAVLAALPSAVLTTLALAVLVVAAVAVERAGRFPFAHVLAGGLLPAASAALLWAVAEVAGVDEAYRAAPILLVVGLIAILLRRIEVETSAAAAAVAAALPAIEAATDVATSLALHLTLAGALVAASALITPSRRPLGWLGGLLLAAATWVRLADLGVQAPEAYTLPSAVALLLVGLWRLHRDPAASTGLALTPGLVLATVPSLLWTMVDPISTRAVLLGAGCLALVLVGVRLRWSSPLVVGSVVGGLLVLRELAPYAVATPQWVLIGAAGTLLTVVGVTWERRLRDLQLGLAYLGRLR